jgi:hypothetical protein
MLLTDLLKGCVTKPAIPGVGEPDSNPLAIAPDKCQVVRR